MDFFWWCDWKRTFCPIAFNGDGLQMLKAKSISGSVHVFGGSFIDIEQIHYICAISESFFLLPTHVERIDKSCEKYCDVCIYVTIGG